MAAASLLLTVPIPAMAAADPHAEVAAALFAASATQEAVVRAADAKLPADQAKIGALAAQVRAGKAERAQLIAAQDGFVAELAEKDRAYAQAIAAFRGAVTDIASTPRGRRGAGRVQRWPCRRGAEHPRQASRRRRRRPQDRFRHR